MSIRKKKDLFNLGEYTIYTLQQLDKEELLEHISMLNNNIQAHKEREEVIRARLRKCYEYLTKQGLSYDEINNITKLECEMR